MRSLFGDATSSFRSEEDKDSIQRELVNKGRLEIHCKL